MSLIGRLARTASMGTLSAITLAASGCLTTDFAPSFNNDSNQLPPAVYDGTGNALDMAAQNEAEKGNIRGARGLDFFAKTYHFQAQDESRMNAAREGRTTVIVNQVPPQPTQEQIRQEDYRGQIKRVWVDYNAIENDQKGMKIHANFDIVNQKGKKTEVAAFFLEQDGSILMDKNNKYRAPAGEVSVGKIVYPVSNNTVFGNVEQNPDNDFYLFMPFDELDIEARGKHDLVFLLFVGDLSEGRQDLIDKTDPIGFSYTKE